MKKLVLLLIYLFSFVWVSSNLLAQEPAELIETEKSAEIFLEEYTDEFQENFFEALKQKGIQNYDRAANLFLKCKQLHPDDSALDHELAKMYLLDKQYITAQQYAVEAIIAEPENYWYLHTLNQILNAQGNNFEGIKNNIPYSDEILRYHLAQIQFKNRKFNAALEALKGLPNKDSVDFLRNRIKDSIQKIENPQKPEESPTKEITEDPVQQLKGDLEVLLTKADYQSLLESSEGAVEEYPLQPYFYYLNGLALNKLQRFKEAAEVLESGLDYLFDDPELAKKFYNELVTAYNGTGNPSKANEYLSKLKSGL